MSSILKINENGAVVEIPAIKWEEYKAAEIDDPQRHGLTSPHARGPRDAKVRELEPGGKVGAGGDV
jgi:hypothetical protein